jgi:hypothetical protein
MLVYPQLATGALCQFPIRKQRFTRTICNTAPDGSVFKLADPAGGSTLWTLEYAGLTDPEIEALGQFFRDAEGTLNQFTFLDPAGNLLAQSEHLAVPMWEKAPSLSVSAAGDGPLPSVAAWRLTNLGAGRQTLTQTLAAPGDYSYSFSIYLRAETAAAVSLILDNARLPITAGPDWSRFALCGKGTTGQATIAFGVELPAGCTVVGSAPQVDAQASASPYQASMSGGVYEDSRLGDDVFSFVTTANNCHSCTVRVIHANHL